MALSVIRTLSLTTNQIRLLFTDVLDPNIGVNNVTVESIVNNVPNSVVNSVLVEDNVLTVNFRPIFPRAQYIVTLLSTDIQPFRAINGERLVEDGNRNTVFITSPGESEAEIRDNMLDSLSIVYESEEPSLVRDLVTSLGDQLQKGKDAIDTTRAANYLSVLVENERKVRSDGPTDKFLNGGVYEVLRVASSVIDATRTGSIQFDSERYASFVTDSVTIVNSIIKTLPGDPVSLQSIDVIKEQVSDDISAENFFSGLRIRVAEGPVAQVIAVTLKRNNTFIPYDINQFGYTILDNRYDTENGSRNVNLTDRDIDLSPSSLTGGAGGFVQPVPGDIMFVSYVYKKIGRDVDPETVELSTIKQAVRELTPAIVNSFSLENAPIVLANDIIPSLKGVTFLNVSAADGNPPFTTIHPAFTREIVFDPSKSPAKPGEYSVNYETGEVLVFGENIGGEGTGTNPPAADYLYRKIYTQDVDYTFDSDIDELSARSISGIIGTEAKVTFDYEDTFAEGEDFRFLSHVEALNERVDNRLISAFTLETLNYPITDVFRVFNETTGEIYNIERFNDTSIFFSGRQAPVQIDADRERVSFVRVPQEVLLISDELINSYSLSVFKIDLANRGVTNSLRTFIGAPFDTSTIFSRTDLFANERFYEDRLFNDVNQNIDRLVNIGDYMIDYNNGIIYVAVSDDQSSDLGDITYEYKDILTRHEHILSVYNIFRSASTLQENITDFIVGNITDTTVNIVNLNQVGERFINNNPTRPLLIGSYQSGEDGVTVEGENKFVSNSAIFTAADIGRTLRLGSTSNPPAQDVTITGIINDHEVLVTPDFTDTAQGRVWVILDLSGGAPKTITLENDIISVRDIYTVEQLGTLTAEELDGYFDINRDSFDGNVITLGDDNPLEVGDAVIVNYNFGNLFIDYRYLRDNLIISYEYGNNSLDWSISTALDAGDEYFVTYRYGALRAPLLQNFGSLTQIPLLTNFPADFDREVYRSIVGGTLQSFIEGPTVPSIERLVESFTGVTPNIKESAFTNWVLGRDFLHLTDIQTQEEPIFDLGRYDNGIVISGDQTVKVPALAHLRLNEGTFSAWIRPEWKGLVSDADVTFDIAIDGYGDISKIYIGALAINPTSMPFTLNISDPLVFGQPNNLDVDVGYFIWFDEFLETWQVRWRENARLGRKFTGTISTSGEIFNVSIPEIDGYEIVEATDLITSSIKTIKYSAAIDCLEEEFIFGGIDGGNFIDTFSATIDGGSFINDVFTCVIDGGAFTDAYFLPSFTEVTSAAVFAIDGLSFAAGEEHYIFDMGDRPDANRMSLYKDGTGYLNFQVLDNAATRPDRGPSLYNIATSIRDWEANEVHHVAVTWKFNSVIEQDFMHLFVDGFEVPALFKYGGHPKANSDYTFGSEAEEVVILSSTSPIVGGFDGSTEAGSDLFISQGIDFEDLGIQVGDTFTILDETPDGTDDPLTGGVYIITGVGGNTVTLDRSLTLTLGNVSFSVNQFTKTVETHINFQDFIVLAIDGYGNETELEGVAAEEPDYTVTRGTNASHIISVNNGVLVGNKVLIKPLGLIFRRCKGTTFLYGDSDKLRFIAPPPVTLSDVDITKINVEKTLIEEGPIFSYIDGYSLFASLGGDGYASQITDGYVTEDGYLCQPSNQLHGRTLAVTLSGDNINYSGSDNTVTIRGLAFSGATEEVLIFTENATLITSEYWRNLESIEISISPINIASYAGVIEIREARPLNESENFGNFAEVVDYSNGIFTLETYGSGGAQFVLESCFYEIDYPSFLDINLDGPSDYFCLGSDIFGDNKFDGVIDEVKILKTAITDTRPGEPTTAISITNDFVSVDPSITDDDTVLLLHFDDDLEDSSVYYDAFDNGFQTAPSVNELFGTALKIADNRPFIISNAGGVFNNNEGTIEFWVSPMEDNRGDPNNHYYIDMSSVVVEELVSVTAVNVIIGQRARSIESVRLLSDTFNIDTNYFVGGSLSNIDGRTITLGTPLPAQHTLVKVTYVPASSRGDRVSIFKDNRGFINFHMIATGVEHLISTPIDWKRHTWHRVMVMWKTNSTNNEDRLRLFVDGNERGTIKYGTGLVYGTGVIYGQAEVRPGANRFVVDNIDLTDTFSRIYIGTDVFKLNGARARIDHIRFSDIERLQSIRIVGDDTVDVNYTGNTDLAQPVVEDLFTTRLLDFDQEISPVEFFATIINEERGIFRFEVEVIDSFDRVIGDTRLEELLVDLINVIKPAHTEAIVTFIE